MPYLLFTATSETLSDQLIGRNQLTAAGLEQNMGTELKNQRHKIRWVSNDINTKFFKYKNETDVKKKLNACQYQKQNIFFYFITKHIVNRHFYLEKLHFSFLRCCVIAWTKNMDQYTLHAPNFLINVKKRSSIERTKSLNVFWPIFFQWEIIESFNSENYMNFSNFLQSAKTDGHGITCTPLFRNYSQVLITVRTDSLSCQNIQKGPTISPATGNKFSTSRSCIHSSTGKHNGGFSMKSKCSQYYN